MNSFLFDTHAHLDLVDNFNHIVSEIDKQKIYTISVTNLPPLYRSLKRIINSKYIRVALGFHPELVGQYKKYIPEMWELFNDTRYIGEVGLDFSVAISTKKDQIAFFEDLIERCNIVGDKILSIHSRGSVETVLEIIGKDFRSKYILHWYSDNLRNLSKAIDYGAYFSINPAMLKSINGKKIISKIPDDKILLESDSPFITSNNSKFSTLEISQVVVELAKNKNKSYDQTLMQLNENFKNLIS